MIALDLNNPQTKNTVFDSTLQDSPRVTRGYDAASPWTRLAVPCISVPSGGLQ
jgi:hypothetical protein